MFFTREALQTNARLQQQWQHLWANRNIWNAAHAQMVGQFRSHMDPVTLAANDLGQTPSMLQPNALAGLAREFWQQVDAQIIEMRDQETGMEIVNDLMAVQTPLPIGKTAKLYNVVGDIAEDVQVSIDGQAPFSFDHTEYDSDGDPIPVFTAGYGVNWRHAAGLNTVGIDLVLDSQRAKMRMFNRKLVSYILDGSAKIQVATFPGQGLRNHRNTLKLNLGTGAGGASIDLTTATPVQLINFFTKGAFGQLARDNFITQYDVLWVSPEIWANLSQPSLVEIGTGGDAIVQGTVLQKILPFIPVREIRQTFALKGNEFLGYQRRRDVVTPLVGMATGVVPLPRTMPQHNYNFQIMNATGLQISRDADGKSGVVYGADLD